MYSGLKVILLYIMSDFEKGREEVAVVESVGSQGPEIGENIGDTRFKIMTDLNPPVPFAAKMPKDGIANFKLAKNDFLVRGENGALTKESVQGWEDPDAWLVMED